MRVSLDIRILALFFAAASAVVGPAAYSAASRLEDAKPAVTISTEDLARAIGSRLSQVGEFRFIEEEAKRLGVRAWLFGGTAAGYAHYVKWDLQRERGDTRFQADRFDYDYTNIYRSNQDLDIVIDGDAEKVSALQRALQEKYPHLQGSKTAWEVRSLTKKIGPKEALLDNPDFLNQNTDSNSTGMIEITKTPGEPVVRDLRDWKSTEPHFLKDVREGKLHYYFSPTHAQTSRAKAGLNPPIFSAIRYLTKAFQFELEMRPEDLRQVEKIVRDFDPERDLANHETRAWVEKNGKKLIQNAVNIEYAWNVMEKLGLREKLISIQDNERAIDSLAWWMNKEPLRTYPVGRGNGKTAREAFREMGQKELIVAHETMNFPALESIIRAHTGDPNVLISRMGFEGETVSMGNGFYTRAGQRGARDTGFNIRFRVDPAAREGTDFIYSRSHQYLVFLNRAALQVIPESLRIGPVEFFNLLRSGQGGFKALDRGILERLSRRVMTKFNALTEQERRLIARMGEEELRKPNPNPLFMEYWLNLPLARESVINDFVAKLRSLEISDEVLKDVLPIFESELKVIPELPASQRYQRYVSLFSNDAIFSALFSNVGRLGSDAKKARVLDWAVGRLIKERNSRGSDWLDRSLNQVISFYTESEARSYSKGSLLDRILSRPDRSGLYPEELGIVSSALSENFDSLPLNAKPLAESFLHSFNYRNLRETLQDSRAAVPIDLDYLRKFRRATSPESKRNWELFDEYVRVRADYPTILEWLKSDSSIDRPERLREVLLRLQELHFISIRDDSARLPSLASKIRYLPPEVMELSQWSKVPEFRNALAEYLRNVHLSSETQLGLDYDELRNGLKFLIHQPPDVLPRERARLSGELEADLRKNKHSVFPKLLSEGDLNLLPDDLSDHFVERVWADGVFPDNVRYVGADPRGLSQTRVFKKVSERIRATPIDSVGPGILTTYLESPKLRPELPSVEEAFLSMAKRRSHGKYHYSFNPEKLVVLQEFSSFPKRIEILKKLTQDFSWEASRPKDLLDVVLRRLREPEFSGEPGAGDLLSLVLKLEAGGRFHNDSDDEDFVAKARALIRSEPYSHDPRARKWNQALDVHIGYRSTWIKKNFMSNGKACQSWFSRLISGLRN